MTFIWGMVIAVTMAAAAKAVALYLDELRHDE